MLQPARFRLALTPIFPLLTATGAGAASQQSLGTVIFGGMLASTLLAIPFVPVFYIITARLGARAKQRKAAKALRTQVPPQDAVATPAD